MPEAPLKLKQFLVKVQFSENVSQSLIGLLAESIIGFFVGHNVITFFNNYIIKTNPKFVRPAEVDLLIGDPMKAKEKLLWKPKHNLDSLIEDMIQADLKRYGK